MTLCRFQHAVAFSMRVFFENFYRTITLLLPPNRFGCCPSASGSLSHTVSFTRYLNSCFESLGRVTSALKLPSFFLLIVMDFCQSRFNPSISTVSAFSILKENFTLQ